MCLASSVPRCLDTVSGFEQMEADRNRIAFSFGGNVTVYDFTWLLTVGFFFFFIFFKSFVWTTSCCVIQYWNAKVNWGRLRRGWCRIKSGERLEVLNKSVFRFCIVLVSAQGDTAFYVKRNENDKTKQKKNKTASFFFQMPKSAEYMQWCNIQFSSIIQVVWTLYSEF